MGGCVRKSKAMAVTPKDIDGRLMKNNDTASMNTSRKAAQRRDAVHTESGTTMGNNGECVSGIRTEK